MMSDDLLAIARRPGTVDWVTWHQRRATELERELRVAETFDRRADITRQLTKNGISLREAQHWAVHGCNTPAYRGVEEAEWADRQPPTLGLLTPAQSGPAETTQHGSA